VGVSRYFEPVAPLQGLAFTRLLEDPFVAALASTHPLARRRSLKAAELDETPVITYPKDPRSRFAEQTVALLRASGAHPEVAYDAEDIHTALGMAASGLGFSLVGRSVGRGNRRDLSFVPVTDLKDRAAVFAVTRSGENSRLVLSFVETLLQTLR
jgi:DNA-binding transcriptional LysR family regulator